MRAAAMPILPPETSLYPASLLDSFEGQERHPEWWVLHTKPRQEKALARHLLSQCIPFYLPLVKKTTAGRRRFESLVPLMAGYVFLCGEEQHRLAALKTNRVAGILDVVEPERLVDELRQLKRLIDSDAPLTPERRLGRGDWVRVRRGPLAGIEGRVIVRRGRRRLLVAVNLLQQGASVEIEDYMLEAAA
jgi:transcriptional antiterminator RfaH